MSLFVLASKDGWVNIMYHGLDAVGIDQQVVIVHAAFSDLFFMLNLAIFYTFSGCCSRFGLQIENVIRFFSWMVHKCLTPFWFLWLLIRLDVLNIP